MPPYLRLGQVPHKRHTQFRKADGSLYHEQLVSSEGFSEIYSIVYHVHAPTAIKSIGEAQPFGPDIAEEHNLKHRCLLGFNTPPQDDYLQSRTIALTNNDCQVIFAAPRQSMDYFFKNADADELIFVHKGTGKLLSGYGELPFGYGDYIHVPRGTIYQLQFDGPDNRLFIVESFSPLRFPKRYMSKSGQLLEHSPFCERDLRGPENLHTHDEQGDFLIQIKKEHQLYPYVYATHPFDYIGWDGMLYPYIFSIHDFEPITGRVHQPPPVHQTFEGHNFVVCSFVPRLYDYHPEGIPAPYNHSNIDSDEVLYYVDGDFMSRKHVEQGMITLHPAGIPHGPHPGTVEKSIGQKGTEELAVMVDTFKPLKLTKQALAIEQPGYYRSWHNE